MGNIEYRIYSKWVTFFEANSELVTFQGRFAWEDTYGSISECLYRGEPTLISV